MSKTSKKSAAAKPLKGQLSIFDSKAKKKPARNPFMGADEIYTTKDKIAVVKSKVSRKNKVNRTTIVTKYYEKNARNKRMLRKVATSVRRGRNGTKYDAL